MIIENGTQKIWILLAESFSMVVLAKGVQPNKKTVFYFEKNGFDFPHYKKTLAACASICYYFERFRGLDGKTSSLPKMAKTRAPPWPKLFSPFLLD